MRPWNPTFDALPGAVASLERERLILAQSGLYPHAGYDSRLQLLTTETLRSPDYAGAALLIAPGVSAYPLDDAELNRLRRLPLIQETPPGLLAVRR